LANAAAFGIGGVAFGVAVGAKGSATVLLIVWDTVIVAFLFIWLTNLLAEIQRSEMIDLTRLFHLPVTLRQVFALNYLASHFTPAIFTLVPAMLGLSVGLTIGNGIGMALLVPLVLSVVFAVTSWTYCLRGWLAGLMMAKRKKRAILAWVTLLIVALAQAPN